jgi:CubicO group peptidase (beta-lactamase class C family)
MRARCAQRGACLSSDLTAGLALAFVEEGEVAREQVFGFADRARRVPLSAQHVFQAASIAKTLTAWAVARAVERRKLDFDAPIGRYLRRSSFPADITVRRILSHTAGLSLPDFPGIDPGSESPRVQVRAIEAAGSGFRYSGGGYALLAAALEEITGESFAAHMARTVLEPLGMRRSTFDQHSPLANEAATGHDQEGRALPFYRFEGAAAAAGLFSTAADLARFAAAHFSGLAPRSLAMLTTPCVVTGRVDGLWAHYGLGYEIEALPQGRTLVGHHGVNRGWRALLAIEPAARRALVALANSDAAAPALDAVLVEWIGS